MSINLMPFIWVTITLPILLILQRWIHRHLHGLSYLITGNKNWATILYAIILFPGVLLHELSHWITATLLGVRTGAFSLLPKTKSDGSIQLGYVEYYKTSRVGPVRESLIGAAPLVTGSIVVLLIGIQIFDVNQIAASIQTGDIQILADSLSSLFSTADFLIWLYLLFAVSNAMMPSSSDRKAWPAFALIMALIAVILYLLGLQDYILAGVTGPVATLFGFLGLAFSLTIGVNLFFMLIVHIAEWLISRAKGVDVVYGKIDS
jgi:hypothetical protein